MCVFVLLGLVVPFVFSPIELYPMYFWAYFFMHYVILCQTMLHDFSCLTCFANTPYQALSNALSSLFFYTLWFLQNHTTLFFMFCKKKKKKHYLVCSTCFAIQGQFWTQHRFHNKITTNQQHRFNHWKITKSYNFLFNICARSKQWNPTLKTRWLVIIGHFLHQTLLDSGCSMFSFLY